MYGSPGKREIGVAWNVPGEGVREGAHDEGELSLEVLYRRGEDRRGRGVPIPPREGEMRDGGGR